MKSSEFITEGKKDRRDVKRTVKPRNPVAHAAQKVAKGSGAHKDKKNTIPRKQKHKTADIVGEEAPKGWEGTVKAMKKHKDIDNPWALAWSMKNKGYTSHKKEAFDREYDDEAGMVDNNLETMKRAVDGLDHLINAGDNLPEWCQEKIAVAKSMLVAVWDYMESEEHGVEEESKYPFAGAKVGQKEGPAGQLKGTDPKGYPKGKLVGGGM